MCVGGDRRVRVGGVEVAALHRALLLLILAPNGWVPEATAVLLLQATWLKEENKDHEPERPISPRENNS
jgi:hypothetical protein